MTHPHSIGTGWRDVAAHAARLGLTIGAYAGLLVVFHTALNTNPPIPIPLHPPAYLHHHLGTVAAISVLCGLTWLVHRAARPRATRVGAALMLAVATACCLTTNLGGPDLSLAVCVLSFYGGVAVCAFLGAGHPTTSATSGRTVAQHHRLVRIGLAVAAFAVFILNLWTSLDTRLDQHWVWLTWSICIWSSGIIGQGGPIRAHPTRLRSEAVVGCLLLPTAIADVHLSGSPATDVSGEFVAWLVALVALALALVVAGGCWWLSQGQHATCLSGLDADSSGADRPSIHTGGGHHPEAGAR